MALDPLKNAATPLATAIAKFAPSANRIARRESPPPAMKSPGGTKAGAHGASRVRRGRVSADPTRVAISSVRMKAESITLDVDGDGQVSGLLLQPTAAMACYVFAHGAGAGMAHTFM